MPCFPTIEPLEARIAPALTLNNPVPDIFAGPAKTGATVDLSQLTAPVSSSAYHTVVEFTTNYDTDPVTPGLQAGVIKIELYDDLAPLTVQDFLRYATNTNASGDYTGTIFHRAGQNFVLQGGGFNATTPSTHIPVFAPVHNEPDPVNRQNDLGTVALAKVGNDPNSGTSEWFVNLADNTSLDTSNGGFTVFGKVISGLSVATAISKLPYYKTGSDGTGTPVQNYNSDPDNNPNTPAPAPTVDQYVRVTATKVSHAPVADTTGLTYSVVHVYDAGTTNPTDLLTASVKGSTLNLKYAPGKTGYADVVVRASNGTETVQDVFKVGVRPNLIAKITGDTLSGAIVPGDTATVNFNVSNNGGAVQKGPFNIQIGLAKLDVTKDGNGNITALTLPTNYTTTVLTTLANTNFNLGSGLSQAFSTKVQIPTQLASSTEAFYQLVVTLSPTGGTTERFTDDDVALNGAFHDLLNQFGTFSTTLGFGSRVNAVLKTSATDTNGQPTLVTWSMSGPGSGTLAVDGKSLSITGTTAASSVTAAVAKVGSHVALQGVQFDNLIGTVYLGSVDFTGLIVASGGVKTLTLGNLTGQSLLLIGPALPDNSLKSTITLGSVHDFSLESGMSIATLSTTEWLDTTGTATDTITAPAIATLKTRGSATSRGDFEADVSITDPGTSTAITVVGLLHNSTIQTSSNLGAIILGGIDQSKIFAGTSARPASLSEFSSDLTLQSFAVLGIKGYAGSLFANSQVAAQTIGTITVKGVSATGQGDFGFVADVIKSYSRTGAAGTAPFTRSNLTTPQTVDDLGDYAVKIL